MTISSRILSTWVCVCLAIGCSSSSSGPKLVPADGKVTFQGQPLAGATVMFVPEKGPFAMGITDKDGKFQLSTGTSRGVVVGPVKVSVTAAEGGKQEDPGTASKRPQTPAETAEFMKKAEEFSKAAASGKADAQPKSRIPEKFGKTETSGLSFVIKPSDNHFPIDL